MLMHKMYILKVMSVVNGIDLQGMGQIILEVNATVITKNDGQKATIETGTRVSLHIMENLGLSSCTGSQNKTLISCD